VHQHRRPGPEQQGQIVAGIIGFDTLLFGETVSLSSEIDR